MLWPNLTLPLMQTGTIHVCSHSNALCCSILGQYSKIFDTIPRNTGKLLKLTMNPANMPMRAKLKRALFRACLVGGNIPNNQTYYNAPEEMLSS